MHDYWLTPNLCHEPTVSFTGSTLSSHCLGHNVRARLPPTINPDPKPFSTWVAPPPGWFYGNWKATYTSQPAYFSMQNMQYDFSPVFPQSTSTPGRNNDITSFQLANQSTVFTAYGIDTPRRSKDPSLGPEWDAVYDFTGMGALATVTNTWQIIAWGYDTLGDGYLVLYETPVAATGASSGLDIESRSENGPSLETLIRIYSALTALGNEELTGLVYSMQKQVVDGRRSGTPPVQCDIACVNNTGLPPGIILW